jgi:WYL_2, Sm-like SH3 beta-barrel fold
MSEFLIKNILSEILFENRICESLDDREIVNYLYEALMLEKLLYGEPVNIEELRHLLRKKILNFEFIKLNGEIRPAKGTLMMKYVPQAQHPKGIRPSSPKVATFYDLEKQDWRSVSQRSKEIVLKKDEETGKPVIMVKDKPEGGEVAVGKAIEKPVEQPKATIDQEPVTAEPKTSDVEVINVKPVKSTEETKIFHFVNPKTGATRDVEMTAKNAIEDLKRMGADWKLVDATEFEEKEDKIAKAAEEKGDYLEAGDVRDYLNVKGDNIHIEILGQDPEGGFYARRIGGGLFKIPAGRMRYIGQKIKKGKPSQPPRLAPKGPLDKYKDLDNTEADEII